MNLQIDSFQAELAILSTLDEALDGGSVSVSVTPTLSNDTKIKIAEIKAAVGDAQALAQVATDAARAVTDESTAALARIRAESSSALGAGIQIS